LDKLPYGYQYCGLGQFFLSGFKPEVSIWAPFFMVPYFLLGFAVFLGFVFVVDRWVKPILGEGSMIIMVPPFIFVPFALLYFPAQLLLYIWRAIFN
jgi:hypothetical protein